MRPMKSPVVLRIWDDNEEGFFAQRAYFEREAKDLYKSLRTILKAEINEESCDSLYRVRLCALL